MSGCCSGRSETPHDDKLGLQTVDPIPDDTSPEMAFMYQVLEGIKLAAEARVQVEELLDKEEEETTEQTVSYNIDGPCESQGVIVMKDYFPACFRAIRQSSGITTENYVQSWSYESFSAIPECKTGAGRSGSLFMLSADKRFMLKTLPHHEVLTLKAIIRNYRRYIHYHPDSKIMRFLALHRFRNGKHYQYLLITNNINYTNGLSLEQRFDLKGRVIKPSSFKKIEDRRHSADGLIKTQADGVVKDNELQRNFCPINGRDRLIEILQRDAAFLAEEGCIDYSLLIGVHGRIPQPVEDTQPKKEEGFNGRPSFEIKEQPAFELIEGEWNGRSEVYSMGIIDFLSRWCTKKKVANFCKTFLWTPETLSTVPPAYYHKRWDEYIPHIIVEPSPDDTCLRNGKTSKAEQDESHEAVRLMVDVELH